MLPYIYYASSHLATILDGSSNRGDNQLAIGINYLIQQEGRTPDEEGEAVLAILMGYTIAVRNRKNIGKAMLRAQEVLPKITDPVLKCRLTVFCYGECYDEELAQTAHQLIEEQKEGGRDPQLAALEELLLAMQSFKR